MDDLAGLVTRHRLSVTEYDRMGEAGVFGPEARIELIEGDLVDMAPIGQEHEGLVMQLNERLVLALGGRAIVSPQNSLRLGEWSAPEPDLVVLRRRADFYMSGARAGAADALLVIEVADSSLAYDRGVKVGLYARAGVPEVWVVDVKGRSVEVFRGGAGDGYSERVVMTEGVVRRAAAPEIEVGVGLVFG